MQQLNLDYLITNQTINTFDLESNFKFEFKIFYFSDCFFQYGQAQVWENNQEWIKFWSKLPGCYAHDPREILQPFNLPCSWLCNIWMTHWEVSIGRSFQFGQVHFCREYFLWGTFGHVWPAGWAEQLGDSVKLGHSVKRVSSAFERTPNPSSFTSLCC